MKSWQKSKQKEAEQKKKRKRKRKKKKSNGNFAFCFCFCFCVLSVSHNPVPLLSPPPFKTAACLIYSDQLGGVAFACNPSGNVWIGGCGEAWVQVVFARMLRALPAKRGVGIVPYPRRRVWKGPWKLAHRPRRATEQEIADASVSNRIKGSSAGGHHLREDTHRLPVLLLFFSSLFFSSSFLLSFLPFVLFFFSSFFFFFDTSSFCTKHTGSFGIYRLIKALDHLALRYGKQTNT